MLTFYLIPAIFLFYLIWFFYKKKQIFKNMGLPSETGNMLFGSVYNIVYAPEKMGNFFYEGTQKYGRNWGYFKGTVPELVTSDLAVVQDVFEKKFSHFHGRAAHFLDKENMKDTGLVLIFSNGLKWKRVRTITNPIFLNANLKKYYPNIVEATKTFLDIISTQYDKDNQRVFDMGPYNEAIVIDAIAKSVFGELESCQYDHEHNVFKQLCDAEFGPKTLIEKSAVAFLCTIPEIYHKKFNIYDFVSKIVQKNKANEHAKGLYRTIYNRIESRRVEKVENREEYEKHQDFINYFLDYEFEGKKEELNTDLNNQPLVLAKGQPLSSIEVEKKLTTEEIIDQCTTLILAGYETTSSSLSYSAYYLATNPECQDRILEEMEKHLKDPDNITFEDLEKLVYLEACIKESLRLRPLALKAVTRNCMASCKVGSIDVPEGMNIFVDVMSIHYDKTIWGEDADQYRPDRWLEKVRPRLAFLAFGAGPRTCSGLKMSLYESKYVYCKLLQKFKLIEVPETKPLEIKGVITDIPVKTYIKLQKR